MKKIAVLLLVLALSLTSAAYAQSFTGKVLAVQDSDNITIMNNGSAVSVRLYCIACPAQGQDYSPQAIKYLQDLMVGQNADVQVKWQDYSKHQVSKVKINGNDVGAQIAGAGLAWYDDRVYQDGEVSAGRDTGTITEALHMVAAQPGGSVGISDTEERYCSHSIKNDREYQRPGLQRSGCQSGSRCRHILGKQRAASELRSRLLGRGILSWCLWRRSI